jgi:hypothetical protein
MIEEQKGDRMATLEVEVKGARDGAKLTLDGAARGLTQAGSALKGTFEVSAGKHRYTLTVYGASGQAWSATVSTAQATHEHEGHMSADGYDTTGPRTIEA